MPVASPEKLLTEPRIKTVPRQVPQRARPVGGGTRATTAIAALYREPEPAEKRVEETIAKRRDTAMKIPPRSTQSVPSIDIGEVLSRTKAGLKNASLQEHSAPFIAELSQQVKDSIPTIYYSLHDYSSNASRSSVVLNGERVTAGQSVKGELRLEEILSDSIVLNIRGTQFRLKALNSWVNL